MFTNIQSRAAANLTVLVPNPAYKKQKQKEFNGIFRGFVCLFACLLVSYCFVWTQVHRIDIFTADREGHIIRYILLQVYKFTE